MIDKELSQKLDHISDQLDNLTTLIYDGITKSKSEVFLPRQAGNHLVRKLYKP